MPSAREVFGSSPTSSRSTASSKSTRPGNGGRPDADQVARARGRCVQRVQHLADIEQIAVQVEDGRTVLLDEGCGDERCGDVVGVLQVDAAVERDRVRRRPAPPP